MNVADNLETPDDETISDYTDLQPELGALLEKVLTILARKEAREAE